MHTHPDVVDVARRRVIAKETLRPGRAVTRSWTRINSGGTNQQAGRQQRIWGAVLVDLLPRN
jgi:hypothetical protein